ncbi:MAG: hypothetical protein ACXVB0_18145 [Mucilaginibacter sp.]
MENFMKNVLKLTLRLAAAIILSAIGLLQPLNSFAQDQTTVRDGQRDFDFDLGKWKTHMRLLVHPLTGSNDWVDVNGTVTVRKVWDGHALLEEVETDGLAGHFEGLTLLLYQPKMHKWAQHFVDASTGVMNQPLIGEFKNGRGEFTDQITLNGQNVLVRFVWSDITTDSHHLEQSFSKDGGKTWEPNFVATLTRAE